ncbi:hypothetical protein [Paenibacillus sp. FSL K6-2862]|uniref:hypothetical protein n=1 Tax=Paenibacillus sp. FSL K6-2862 TaxID=2921484 RepID=UPI0030F7BA7E
MFDELHNEIRSHYKELAPHLDDSTFHPPEETIEERRAITEETGIFSNVMVREYSEILTYSSGDYVALLNTNSKHRQLPDKPRDILLDKIKNSIDRSGGTIYKEHRVALFLGRKLM